MEWHKNHEKLSFKQAIKSINANYKDGENGFEIKSFGNVLEQSILKKELQPFREKKSSIYGRIKSFRKKYEFKSRLTDLAS
jgi:hypothetical protein